jgi:hypothetical protein
MARNRFVSGDVVRLYLVDVHRRAYKELEAKLREAKTPEDIAKLTADLAAERLSLAEAEKDGDWIDVKADLNAGEARGIYADLVKDMHFGERASLDPKRVGVTKILAFLVGWSFVGADGKPVPHGEAAVNNLDTETYHEIDRAIDAHEAAIEKAREERKNGRAGENKLSPISPSVAE